MWRCAVFIKTLLLYKILQSYTSVLVHKTAMLVLSIRENFLLDFVVHFTTLSMSVLYRWQDDF